MKKLWLSLLPVLMAATLHAETPENLVVEGIPQITPEVRKDVARYLEFRAAGFNDWHPSRREMLISTRFADSSQLHYVSIPAGARRQLTFLDEPVADGAFHPQHGRFIVFSQDTGGGEFFQLYRFDLEDARITLLTDGKSRNTGAKWSQSGKWIAYASTRRTGRDNDIYIIDPANPTSNRLVLELKGGGWSVSDWSADETKLLISEYVSINESYIHLLDLKTGRLEPITPRTSEKISYSAPRFSKDGRSIFFRSDKGAEFKQLVRRDLASGRETVLSGHIPWDVDEFELSYDGRLLAFVTNEDGSSVLHVVNAGTGKPVRLPNLPMGVISRIGWHRNNRDLAFSMSSAKAPSDVFSIDVKTANLERWTESETGGLNTAEFVEPELIRTRSFDGLSISAFVYRPDPKKFPGKRPVLVSIHGGPESQSRPVFQGRSNYLVNELGITLVVPNVRGSSGYGKTFLTLDNGYKREDSVRDIGAILDWIARDPNLNKDRVAVIGGSYGGYMVLASMMHFGDRLRAAIDIVGISNFVTFLESTQEYRRDLRRAEYGDERDPEMRAFLQRISPTSNAHLIRKPLFVVQGKNDPRVPVTEAEQMVEAIRKNGGDVWYLMAKDEGHGFAKKKNADYQFFATTLFLRKFLLE
ncbi:MAG: S9 family peptidase [Limisphaerales bacterium]